MNSSPSTNAIIDGLQANDELTPQDRLWMFMMLVDDEAIMALLHKHAMMMKVGMVGEDPVYGLVYAVMKLAKPHLFVEDGE